VILAHGFSSRIIVIAIVGYVQRVFIEPNTLDYYTSGREQQAVFVDREMAIVFEYETN
jgi:hypothetical protein